MKVQEPQKSLSEIFKELEQSKNKQIEEYKQEQKVKKIEKEEEKKENLKFLLTKRNGKENIKLFAIVFAILFCITMGSSNYIFAKDLEETDERLPIGTFEENAEPSDIYEIISQNISNTYQREVLDVEEEIEFETEYIEDDNLPKDESVVVQKGLIREKASYICYKL